MVHMLTSDDGPVLLGAVRDRGVLRRESVLHEMQDDQTVDKIRVLLLSPNIIEPIE